MYSPIGQVSLSMMPGSPSISSTIFRFILHNQLKGLWKKKKITMRLSLAIAQNQKPQTIYSRVLQTFQCSTFLLLLECQTCPVLSTSVISHTMLYELTHKFFLSPETKGVLLFCSLGMQYSSCEKNLLGSSVLFFWYFKHKTTKGDALCSNCLEGGMIN